MIRTPARLLARPWGSSRDAPIRADEVLRFRLRLAEKPAYLRSVAAVTDLPDLRAEHWDHEAFAWPGPPGEVNVALRRDLLARLRGNGDALAERLQTALENGRAGARRLGLPRGESLPLNAGRPKVMGILNVTPDSFHDGGRYLAVDAAVAQAVRLMDEGADVLDIGAESTRPGSEAVSAAEQLARVLPVLEGLRGSTVPISIDTTRAEVASRALQAGARIINDTSALRDDPGLVGVVAEYEAGLILMHRLGAPKSMQHAPRYRNCVAEVTEFLAERIEAAQEGGVKLERIGVDPGIGFGKELGHNLELLGALQELRSLGRPVLLGASRKSFLQGLLGRTGEERLAGTLATTALAYKAGTEWVRVHDVKESRDLLQVLAAVDERLD